MGASGLEATRYEFLSLFFARRPVLFLAVRALAESGLFLSLAADLYRGVFVTRDASGCPGTI